MVENEYTASVTAVCCTNPKRWVLRKRKISKYVRLITLWH